MFLGDFAVGVTVAATAVPQVILIIIFNLILNKTTKYDIST